MEQEPLILISNDDSISAKGLHHLIDCVKEFGKVIAVAPSSPQSGQSSSLSVNKPLRITRHDGYDDAEVYSVSGTPVDCVKLALHAIVPRKPDIMLSGINHGSNSGNAIIYSGTMGAAMEACTTGIPSVGFSLLHHSLKADFHWTTPFVKEITAKVLKNGLPQGICLNVNIPAMTEPLGIKVCRAARGHWSEEYERYLDPNGKPFYWLTGRFCNEEPEATDTDEYWLGQKYISVVPANIDQTATDAINHISRLLD